MARAKRICSKPGCPNPAVTSRCQQHEREHDKARGTKAERGYGQAHINLRKQWAAKVATGTVPCARCGEPIQPGTAWALDHDDHDRSRYLGPSHRHCNDSAGGRASHRRDDLDPT